MPKVRFTANLQRHVQLPPVEVAGTTVRQALENALAQSAAGRGYVLDDQGQLRKHMIVFLDGQAVADRQDLSDPVCPESEIYVMQALSGG